jgi:hypothetical protein
VQADSVAMCMVLEGESEGQGVTEMLDFERMIVDLAVGFGQAPARLLLLLTINGSNSLDLLTRAECVCAGVVCLQGVSPDHIGSIKYHVKDPKSPHERVLVSFHAAPASIHGIVQPLAYTLDPASHTLARGVRIKQPPIANAPSDSQLATFPVEFPGPVRDPVYEMGLYIDNRRRRLTVEQDPTMREARVRAAWPSIAATREALPADCSW